MTSNAERAAKVLGVEPSTTHPAYLGKSVRTNRVTGRRCDGGTCPVEKKYIHYGEQYVRVVRRDGALEMFHVPCFQDEFGEAPDGGQGG